LGGVAGKKGKIKDGGDDSNSDGEDEDDVCLFPMVESSANLNGNYCSSQELVVVNPTAFGSQLKLPSSHILERARLVSLLSRKQQLMHQPPPVAAAPSERETAPASAMTRNTTEDWLRSYRFSQIIWSAQHLSTAAPTNNCASSSSQIAASPLSWCGADAATGWTRLMRAAAGDVAAPGSIARRTFISLGGSSGSGGGAATGGSPKLRTRTSSSKVAAALSPVSMSNGFQSSAPTRTTLVFGKVATESVAQNLASDRNHLDSSGFWGGTAQRPNEAFLDDPGPVVQRYGLLGLACCHILQLINQENCNDGAFANSDWEGSEGEGEDDALPVPATASHQNERGSQLRRRHWRRRLTLSILEIADEEVLYDLLKLKPFSRENAVVVKHGRTAAASGATAGAAMELPPGGGEQERAAMSVATLVGLTDTPIDSLRTLGRCVRRAFTMAYHARRTKPRGSLLATLKVWDDGEVEAQRLKNSRRFTALQFLDLAQAVPEDDGNFWRESQKPRNARLRQSLTALGATLRRVLLREAGNNTIVSYRENSLTQALSRDLSQHNLDSKIVVLASLSPLKSDYSETMSTLRFLSSIVTRPGDPLLSPFDKLQLNAVGPETSHGDVAQADSHTKTTSSPTSQSSSVDADTDSFLSSSPVLQQALLRNVIIDPRQRMAKLLGAAAKARGQVSGSLSALADGNIAGGDSSGSHTPTRYMEVDPGGDAAEAFARHAEGMAQRGEIAASASLPAPLSSPSRTEPSQGYVSVTDAGHAAGNAAVESDTEGSEQSAHQLHANPSPLTTDTGGRSTNFDFLRVGDSKGPGLARRLLVGSTTEPAAIAASPRAEHQRSSDMEEVLAAVVCRHELETDRLSDEIRRLEETVEVLRRQVTAQDREEAGNGDVARDRHMALAEGEAARQQQAMEMGGLDLPVRSKDEDLAQARRQVEALQRQLGAAQQESADQARLEDELERLRLALEARNDQMGDLSSMHAAQRSQSQLRLDNAIAQAQVERDKLQAERSERNRLEQELELRKLELGNRDASLLQLQAEYASAKSNWQQAVQEARATADDRVLQLELASREYAESFRLELQHREEQLKQIEETLASERLTHRKMQDDEAIERHLRELEEARAEVESRDGRVRELEATVENLEAGRKEILQIADEAIRQQAELEKKVAELEATLTDLSHQFSVSKEKLQAEEESRARLAQELQESRQEVLNSKTELNEAQVRVAELEFILRSVERERDHLAQRDSENQRELNRLRQSSLQGKTMAATRDELERLSAENRRLQDELHQAQSLRSKYELELERQLTDREYEVERCHEDAALARDELAALVAEQSAARRVHEKEATDLRGALEASELKVAQLVDEASRITKDLGASRSSISAELEQARKDLVLRQSELSALSRRLESAQEEKEAAVAKASNLKRALASFQDTTRSKVRAFVSHRSDTQELLERTLEENEALTSKNRQLRAALEDVRTNPAGPLGRELDQAISQVQQREQENRELRSLVGRLETSVKALRGEVATARNRSRGDVLYPREDQDRPRRRPEDEGVVAAVMHHAPLDERTAASLVAENRRLEDQLRAYRSGSRLDASEAPMSLPTPPHCVDRLAMTLTAPSSDQMIASLAVAAKASVEQRETELSRMQQQDRMMLPSLDDDNGEGVAAALRRAKVRALHRRVRVLENHRAVVDGLVQLYHPEIGHRQQQQQQREKAPTMHMGDDRGEPNMSRTNDDSSSTVSSGGGSVSDCRGPRRGRTRHRPAENRISKIGVGPSLSIDELGRRVRSLERRMERGLWIG
jgi:DNA repair exonuclease SbcCD ATPase subunit